MCRTGICYEHTTDLCLYIPFCIVYICLGIIQIISGIFYFITIPVIKLIINIGIGCWIILTGISGGIVACVCSSNTRKHEYLLYCSFSVLILNTINLILLEFGQFKELFHENVQRQMSREYNVLESPHARIITTVTAIASIIIAFIQSQITFCLLNKSQIAQRKTIRANRSLYIDNDQYVDLEYVIPKKNVTKGGKTTTVQSANAKSWVFDETFEDHQRQNSSSASSTHSASPAHSISIDPSPYNGPKNTGQKHRRTSRVSDANSERFMHQMTSFSRCATPSPVPRSGQITPTPYNSGDYYDTCGQTSNRLTVEFLSSIAKAKVPSNNNQGPSSLSSMSMQDDSQYASMLAELEQSIIEKKIQAGFSPDDVSQSTDKYCSSKSSSKDLEFSKELEAALQLIQELETPSEGPLEQHLTLSPREIVRSESEKTLSAAVSLPSPEAGPVCGERTVNSPPFRNGHGLIERSSMKEYPMMRKIARLLLAVPAAETTDERNLSYAGLILAPGKIKLNVESLRELL